MKSEEYWALRALQREAETHHDMSDTLKRLAGLYHEADQELSKMIERVFLSYQKYAAVDEKTARELLSAQETAGLLAELRKLYDETGDTAALAKLNAPAYGYRISRLQAVRRAIGAELDKLAAQEEKAGSGRLVKAYDDSYYKTMYDTLPELPGVPAVPLSPDTVSQALRSAWKGENYSSRLWKNRDLLAEEAGKIIDTGIISGKSIQNMTAELSDAMDTGAFAASRLLRSEVNRMHNDAEIQSYREMNLREYRFLATLDARTCTACGKLDGKVFPVSEAKTGVNLPPLHPNDRCTTVAVMPGENEEHGTRIARDPETGRNYKVPGSMTYEQWRKDVCEKYGADSLKIAQKKYWNRKADTVQMKKMREIIGAEVPGNLADFQKLKYNEPEKWEDIKGLCQYKAKYPAAESKHYYIYRDLRALGIKNGIVLPPERVTSYILEDTLSKNPAHIMERMKERHISDDDVHNYVRNSLVMFSQWKASRKAFYSQNGVTVVTKLDGDWIAKTAWSKHDFDEQTLIILEVVQKYVK